jgi:hypothetical protein
MRWGGIAKLSGSLLATRSSLQPRGFWYLSSFVSRQCITTPHRLAPLPSNFRTSSMSSSGFSSPSPRSRVLILGAGNFGSCLASHLGDSMHDVYMWAREEKLVEHFNKYHRNITYLKDHEFPKSITAVGPELPDADFISTMDVVLFAIPTQFLR